MPPSIHASAFAELAPLRAVATSGRSIRSARAAILRRPAGRIGLAIVVAILAIAVVGPMMAPHDPFIITGGSLIPPSAAHPMGTDALGRDLFSAMLHGARTSVAVATAVSAIALACGLLIGMVAGYSGGWRDDTLMRGTELFQVIPRFFFAVVVIAFFGPGLDRLVLTLGLTSWPILARIARSEVIAIRDLDFIRAAEALGASPAHVIRRQLLPNVLPVLLVATGLLFGQVLLLEATLGFLGLGDPSAISWGTLAAQAQGFLRVAWWLALFPGLAITLAVVGVNLLADAADSVA
ncbi:MAG: ABC transporter permease [Gemmatimonadaceae bacterium]